MAIELYDYQEDALMHMKNGCILCGGVGSGKSVVALAYYLFRACQGDTKVVYQPDNVTYPFLHERCEMMKDPKDLYIITTAKKRDSLEWVSECSRFSMHPNANVYGVNIIIDSWNNIKKYKDVKRAFFIFDEQRLVGSGVWVKTFLKISQANEWILLSATPGDQWTDYIPVFIANGLYKNKSEFTRKHCIYSRFAKYPKIERYVGVSELKRNRDFVLVPMKDGRETVRHEIYVNISYDKVLYRTVFKDRWDPWKEEPISETGNLLYLTRKVVNMDESRIRNVGEILDERRRAVIFYNFNYELELLRGLCEQKNLPYAEWNGGKHQDLPEGERWAYLVQYTAGCEGWNCITANTIIFYSQNYSYRITEQAAGRIDRINTPYKDLYYYKMVSSAPIDLAIRKCLVTKRNFNERGFMKGVRK